jgi:hypothetical protein
VFSKKASENRTFFEGVVVIQKQNTESFNPVLPEGQEYFTL